MSDLVSIVLPIYNVERFLDKCVSSIVNQSYVNLEIILVDDGSPDNCPTMCEEWAKKDSRIKVVHKENQGLGMARNTGIEHANGKYIFFFDSDDYVDTSLVEKCIDAAKKHNTDLVWFSMSDVNENGEVKASSASTKTRYYTDNKQVTDELLPELMSHDYRNGEPANFAFSAWSGMFSMDIIREHNLVFPSERQIISEDTYFLLQYFRYVNSAVTLDEILYFHYINTSSLTTTYKADRQDKNNYFFKVTLELIDSLGYCEEIRIRLCMLYHSFTLAALKMVLSSTLTKKEKNSIAKKILKSSTLMHSIDRDVLMREKKSVRMFFKLASMRLPGVCNLILRIKK